MKLLMILGAIIGFLTGTFFGLAARSDWPAVFWHASVAALISGMMMRWWGRVWLKNWKSTLEQKLAKIEAQRLESKPPAASKV